MELQHRYCALVLALSAGLLYGQVNLTPPQLLPGGNASWTTTTLGLTGPVAFKLLVEHTDAGAVNSFCFDSPPNGFPGVVVGSTSDDMVIFGGADIPGKIVTLPVPSGANLSLFHDTTDASDVYLSGPDGILGYYDAYLNSNPAHNYTRVGADQLIKYYVANPAQSYQFTAYGQTVQLGSGFAAFVFFEEDHTPNYDYNDMIVGILPPCDDDGDCNDGLFCNGVEHCDLDYAVCMGGSAPLCQDGVDCTQDKCEEDTNGYRCVFKPHDEACDDENFCNGLESCDAIKGCVATKPVKCDDGVPCTVDRCVDKGVCVFTPDDGLCSDSVFCNGAEVCHRKDGCQPGTPPVCDDGISCTISLCNPQIDECEHVPDPSPCSNGLYCDGLETCDPELGCVPGTPPNCADPHACTTDSCVEDTDSCLHLPDSNVCDDQLYCNGQESCDAVEGCLPGTSPCPQGLSCDEATDTCPLCDSDDDCDDEKTCTGRETCVDAVCVPGEPPACDDGIPCTTGRCDPVTDACVQTPDDSLCSNGLYCDGIETCQLTAGCVPGTPVNCDDGVTCTNDECVESTDICANLPKDIRCDNGLYCDGVEVCHPTQGCLPGSPVGCEDGSLCSVDTCLEASDTCDHQCDVPELTCTNQVFECDSVGEFLPPVIDDDCSEDPVATCPEVITPGKLPQERKITRSCSFTNDCGSTGTCTQIIDVQDTTPPEITCPPDRRFECDGIGDSGQPIVSDNCDPEPQVTVEVETIEGDCTPNVAGISVPPKLVKLNTFTATDGGALIVATGDDPGNISTCVQRIEIVDTHGPVIVECPSSVPGCVDQPLVFVPPSCTDTCGTCTVTCTRSDGLPMTDPVTEGLTISCTSRDECNNASAACNIAVNTINCEDIPALSQWGLAVLALLLMISAKLRFRRGALYS